MNTATKPAPKYVSQWHFESKGLTSCTTPLRKRGDNAPAAPSVIYTTESWQIINYLVKTCTTEIAWLGLVDTLEDGNYLITDIYVPEQEVSGASAEIEPHIMAALAIEIMDAGKDPGKLIYHGHSHVNMGVTPSGTDEKQMEEYLDNCEIFVRGIYNKRGEAKVDVFDRKQQLMFNCVDHYAEHDYIHPDLRKELNALMKTNVKSASFFSQRTTKQRDVSKPVGNIDPIIHKPTNNDYATVDYATFDYDDYYSNLYDPFEEDSGPSKQTNPMIVYGD